METLDAPRMRRHKLSVEQYHRMGEAGVFAPDDRIELIEGEVVDMPPMGTRHWGAVSLLNRVFVEATGQRAVIAPQLPLHLGDASEPEPDIAVLRPREDSYASALPTPSDALLLIEVADSTVDYDLKVKARLYATHGVPVYWVFDLPAKLLHVHTQPRGERYLSVVATDAPGLVELPGLDGASVDLSGVL